MALRTSAMPLKTICVLQGKSAKGKPENYPRQACAGQPRSGWCRRHRAYSEPGARRRRVAPGRPKK
jgi:hypothetical protein